MKKPDRNRQCSCGSGKKYKRCCGVVGSVPALGEGVWQRAIATRERAHKQLLELALQVYETDDLDCAWIAFGEPPTPFSHLDLFNPWVYFHHDYGDGSLARQLLSANRPADADVREYLAAGLATPLSLFEVVELVGGPRLRVRDMLRGGELVVFEDAETSAADAPDLLNRVLLARIVRLNGLHLFDGRAPYTLEPREVAEILAQLAASELLVSGRKVGQLGFDDLQLLELELLEAVFSRLRRTMEAAVAHYAQAFEFTAASGQN
jgi:hypothetical protein